MHRKLTYLGTYIPGRTNYLLLALQVLLALQGASRGMDYVLARPKGQPTAPSLASIEAALPLWIWGIGFLIAAAAIFIGLYAGRVSLIVFGHVVLTGLYGAFAWGLLAEAPIYSLPMAVVGAVVLIIGIKFGIERWKRNEIVRFLNATMLTGIGGWVCGLGLGYDFRTATGLLTAGLAHAAIAIGTMFVTARMSDGRGR